jgi:hypothetical protein
VQAGGEAPDLRLGRLFRRLRQHVDIDAAAAALQGSFNGFDRAALLDRAQAKTVRHHVEQLARAGGRLDLALRLHARVAARGQPLLDLFLCRGFRQFNRKRDHEARVVLHGARHQVGVDRLRRVVPHGLRGLAVEQFGRPRVEQLQMIVEFGHRADRGARTAHRIGLVDRDGGRHAVDAVHLRAVHAVEELARVGAEGFDVAPLPFRVQRVEHQAGFAGPRRAGYDRHLACVQVEIEVLEVVLTRSANADFSCR